MRFEFLLPGVVILLLTAFDIIVTVLGVGSGGGPLTERIGRRMWVIGLWLHRRVSRGGVLQAWGVALVALTPMLWLALLLLGWTLVFSSTDGTVVATQGGAHADLASRIYFVGYTLTTLGNGEFRPSGTAWQFLTFVSALSGLFLVTLAVTYLVPVIQAATHRRRLARTIAALGGTPKGILLQAWDGEQITGLTAQAANMSGDIQLVGERHLTYPVLHYLHSVEPEAAFGPRLAALSDALLIILEGIEPVRVPDRDRLVTLWRSIEVFIGILQPSLSSPAALAPSMPSPEEVKALGIPVDGPRLLSAVEDASDLRRRLLGFVNYDGWDWTVSVSLQAAE